MANKTFEDRFFVGPDEEPDRFEVVETLRGGGEGTVVKARFQLDGTWQIVAIKTLLPERVADLDRWADRWRAQVDLLRLLSDPGVVGVHDGFIGPVAHRQGDAAGRARTLHLVMNWVEGQTLIEWRDTLIGPNAFHQVTRVLNQVAVSLDYLASGRDTNGQSVVHGDLKPANVIVTPSGQARLVDFGLARLAHGTTTAPAGGTKGYLAPEVAAAGQFSPAADRYALGGIAYFLFAGEDPPEFYEPASMRAKLDASTMLAGRAAIVDHVLEMVAAEPAQRATSAAAWARQFELSSSTIELGTATTGVAASDGATVSNSGPERTNASSETSKRRRWPVIVGICLLILLAAGVAGALLLGRDDNTPSDTALAGSPATAVPSSSTTTTSRPPSTTAALNTTSTTRPSSPGAVTGATGIQYLADFKHLTDAKYSSFDTGTGHLGGTPYTRSLLMAPTYSAPSYVEYDLGKKYARLSGAVGVSDEADSRSLVKVEIFADGVSVFDQSVKLGDVVPIDLDMSGVLRLRLQATDLTTGSHQIPTVVFADLKLSPS